MRLYDINAELDALLTQIYEIEDQIAELMSQIDKRTGELLYDPAELEELNAIHDRLIQALEEMTIDREDKLEGLALSVKNYDAEAKAIREEESNLAKRRRALENRAERTRGFLGTQLMGEKFSTAKVAVSWRKSEAVELDEDFVGKADLWWLRVPPPEPDKVKIKAALKHGQQIPGAQLVTKSNMQIR